MFEIRLQKLAVHNGCLMNLYYLQGIKEEGNEMLPRIKKELTTTQIIAYGFLAAILFGSILLSLPIASRDGNATPYIDALFTATTSICVTGLTTVTTIEHWNLFGQIVILCLIQFGGLGVITFTTSILLILHKRITLKERLLIQDAYNLSTLRGLVKLTIRIIKGTLFVEGIGAFFFCFRFIPEFGIVKGLWKSVFHSVSAFCNAGIDLIGPNSFSTYTGSVVVNLTTMILIIAGGIGFPVWWDIVRVIKNSIKDSMNFKKTFKKLTLHSKIAISMTFVLIISGAFLLLLFEYNNPNTIGNLSFGEKVIASFFQSVTTRTAGYFTISQQDLSNPSAFLCIILMFIGGSPSGTAGGIKTVTLVALIISTISVIKGREETEIFDRKITAGYIRKALAVTLFSLFILILSILSLSLVENADFIDIVYESTSAIATVGLTRGLTPNLSVIGKIIIIITMYLGRIGPITLALMFNPKKGKVKGRSLPEEEILIG